MNTKQRWRKAQQYEKEWWEHMAPSLDLEYYAAFAADLRRELADLCPLNEESTILEIGSGAAGTITFLPGKRCALDPLEHIYGQIPEYRKERDPAVKYIAAQGERIPCRDGQFDLIIIDNVLDHCENPGMVINELFRTLKDGGTVYFRLNTYHRAGMLVRSLLELLQLDRGHPFSFTRSKIVGLFKNSGLSVVSSHSSGFLKTWLNDIRLFGFRSLIKSLLLINRSEVLLILQKR